MQFDERVIKVMEPVLEDLVTFYITGSDQPLESQVDCDCCQSADELLRLEYLRGLL